MSGSLRRLATAVSFLFCLVVAPGGSGAAFAQASGSGKPRPENVSVRTRYPLTDTGFEHFYNLDHDHAIQDSERVREKHPADPFAVNHLITGVLIRELYRMGAMNTREYENDSFIGQAHRPADLKIKARIKQLVQRAEKLEEKQLKANPNDVDALYARGVTRGQFATYTALVERAWFSALRNAVGARHDHERVLELAPEDVQAKLIVGAHNYVIGSLPWGAKVAASVVGLAGHKEKGLKYLQECAAGGGETSVDAKVLLTLKIFD